MSNKTEYAAVLVAETAGNITGVGMVSDQGEVLLNYVKPQARFSGVSTALLRALEEHARGMGATACVLETTLTAKPFYEAQGYRPQRDHDLDLRKSL